jgi:hypothetical protein
MTLKEILPEKRAGSPCCSSWRIFMLVEVWPLQSCWWCCGSAGPGSLLCGCERRLWVWEWLSAAVRPLPLAASIGAFAEAPLTVGSCAKLARLG